MKRRLVITGVCLAGFALLAVLATLMTGVMVRAIAARIPVEWEKQVGDGLMAELKMNETFVEDPAQKARLKRTVAPLMAALPASKVDFQFYIVEERMANAFALPGGHVVVTTGLLERKASTVT